LRPGRAPLRLESEWVNNAQQRRVQITHCYGHGGSGVTLAFGCAEDVLRDHVKPFLQQHQTMRSRL
jgi:D-amino-acid oxidase